MTNEEILKNALNALNLEVDAIIVSDIRGKANAAMEEAKKEGFKNACELLDSMFSKCSTHEYMLGDCLLAKVNLLKGKPRTNQGRGEGPVWVKAESELPKPFVNVFFRIASVNYLSAGFYDDKAKRIYCNCLKQLIDNGFKEIEWLKEPDKLEQSKKEQ